MTAVIEDRFREFAGWCEGTAPLYARLAYGLESRTLGAYQQHGRWVVWAPE